MKKQMMALAAVFLSILLCGCIVINVPEKTSAPESKETEEKTTEETTTETTEEVTTTEATTTAPTEEVTTTAEEKKDEIVFEPGLFAYLNMGAGLISTGTAWFNDEGRFGVSYTHSDGSGGASEFGNYTVDGSNVDGFIWFTQAGDPALEAAPGLVDHFTLKDENTLILDEMSFTRVTDADEIAYFEKQFDIRKNIDNGILYNKYMVEEYHETEDPSPAVAYYEFESDGGMLLQGLQLVLFENGRYWLGMSYSDGSAGPMEIGHYTLSDEELITYTWFSRVGDPTITAAPYDYLQFFVSEDGDLFTVDLGYATDGKDIRIPKVKDADLSKITKEYDLNAAFLYARLANKKG